MGGLFAGGFRIYLVISHTPVEIYLLINYVLYATDTSNRKFLKILPAFSFLTL